MTYPPRRNDPERNLMDSQPKDSQSMDPGTLDAREMMDARKIPDARKTIDARATMDGKTMDGETMDGETIYREPVRVLGGHRDCREALDRLYTFLDGELTEDRRHEIQHHLESCAPCLEAFDFEAELKLLVSRRCRDEVPERLKIRVTIALQEASVAFRGSEHRAGKGHPS